MKHIITVKNVSKSFRLPHEVENTIKWSVLNIFRKKRYEEFEALSNINFNVMPGEFLGIIGANGSGKTTLLKVIAGIYHPDQGSVKVNGEPATLLELGVGFHWDLTAKENVYLSGAVMGMGKKELDEKYAKIVEFSEEERFMDQKLKNLSTGMKVRIAFALAIQSEARIFLLDENLSVGDSRFQEKCYGIFEKFKKEGRTMLFISHDMEAIRRFTTRTIWLDKGRIAADGHPDEVIRQYLSSKGTA